LRRFLHGRAVECYFPQVEGVDEVTAPCRVGRQDIGLWLLENGWARPNAIATDDYRGAATTAACDRLGLHRGETAPGDCTLPKG
jgi:endonuclease YncB( thermonuclease family)